MIKSITKYLTVETLLHLVMVTFAVASVFNISTYMSASHNLVMSWCIGLSLGFGLVGLSLILSKVDTSKILFKKMLVATISVCLLSGTLQMLSYHEHGQTWFLSALFGYGFPVVAELILALAISAYDEDQKIKKENEEAEDKRKNDEAKRKNDEEEKLLKQMKLHNATQGLREKSALVIADSLDNYDPGEIQKFINKEISGIVKAQVGGVLAEIKSTYAQEIDETVQDFNGQTCMPTPQIEDFAQKSAQLNKERADQKKEELQTFAQFLAQNYNGCATDEFNYSKLEREFGKSRRTIQRYVAELQQADIINGHVDASLIMQM